MLPDYHYLEKTAEQLTVALTFSADNAFFAGHFEGFPVLPAVAQLFVAQRIAEDGWGALSGFSRIKTTKFFDKILPDTPLILTLTLTRNANTGDRDLQFCYRHGELVKSSGKMIYSKT